MCAYISDKKTHVELSVLVILSRFLAKAPSIQVKKRNPHTFHAFIGSHSYNMYHLVCQFQDTTFQCMWLHVMPIMMPQLKATYYSNEVGNIKYISIVMLVVLQHKWLWVQDSTMGLVMHSVQKLLTFKFEIMLPRAWLYNIGNVKTRHSKESEKNIIIVKR